MRLKIMAVALLTAALAGPAAAQFENLRVAPHPVPYPTFDDSTKKETTAVNVDYVHSSLKQADLGLSGFDLGVGYRRAISPDMAWDAHLAIAPEFGSTNGVKVYNVAVPLSTNFEWQPWKTSNANVILFAGPNLQLASANFEAPANYGGVAGIVPAGNGVNTRGSSSWTYGLQFGAQGGYDTGSVMISPYFSLSPDWISYSRKFYNNGTLATQNGSTSAAILTTIGAQAFLQNGLGLHFTYQSSPGIGGSPFKSYHNILTGINWAF